MLKQTCQKYIDINETVSVTCMKERGHDGPCGVVPSVDVVKLEIKEIDELVAKLLRRKNELLGRDTKKSL